MRGGLAAVAVLVGAACTCGVPGVDDDLYACDDAADCISGFACVAGRCQKSAGTCEQAGAAPQMSESLCSDGLDNDCDQRVDCADSTCAGQTCSSRGSCAGGVCQCSEAGTAPQTAESFCNDGLDNDCDGQTDCEDPQCAGHACGGGCECAGNAKSETLCSDGLDNDGDGQTDCADPQCSTRACDGNQPAAVCCGQSCRNLATDPMNCGGCGVNCRATCLAANASGVASGRCECMGMGQCPLNQICNATLCSCSASSQCASGQSCAGNVCVY